MEDEVDRLIRAWRAERPQLNVGPMHVLSRVSRLARHLDRARRQVFADHGLTVWEFDVLAALRRSGAPYQLSPGQLVRETLVTSGTMTNRIDRLAARGLLHRRADPLDRRGVHVRLTDEGRQRVDSAIDGLLACEQELLAGLNQDDQRRLGDLLRVVVLPFDDANRPGSPNSAPRE